MNGPEHYREAERLADAYKSAIGDIEGLPHDTERQRLDRLYEQHNAHALLSKAQVHATLAVAAATAQPCACGSPDTYSLNPAEVVTHSAKACWVSPVSDGGAS